MPPGRSHFLSFLQPPISGDYDSCGNTNLGFGIPSALDWFSTDIYHMDGEVSGWVDQWVKSFYEMLIYPNMTDEQQVGRASGRGITGRSYGTES